MGWVAEGLGLENQLDIRGCAAILRLVFTIPETEEPAIEEAAATGD